MYISNNNQQNQSNKNHPGSKKSPNLPRKPSNVNKEFLSEVEEKLKAMRQKRLSRLNAFVDEQSKLSEVRNKTNDIEEEDMDQVIKSMQKEPEKVRHSFRAVAEQTDNNKIVKNENNRSEVENLDSRQISKNKSSTIKFISKFSCVGVSDVRSSVDFNTLDKDPLYLPKNNIPESKKKETFEDVNKKPDKLINKYFQRKTINFPDNFSIDQYGQTEEESCSKTLPHTYPSLYSSDRFADRISRDTIKSEDVAVERIKKNSIKRNSLGDLTSSNNEDIRSYERLVKHPMITFGKSTPNLTEISSEQYLEAGGLGTNQTDEAKLKKEKTDTPQNKFQTFALPVNTVTLQNTSKYFTLPVNSVISNNKSNKEDKILRKLQRNWVTVAEILENNSEVDDDEMEDFKNTLNEAEDLLLEYQRKVKELKYKKQPTIQYKEKLEEIRDDLKEIRKTIITFRGLRRDDEFVEMLNRLSDYAREVKNVPGLSEEKSVMLSAIDNCVKSLESRTNRNEMILQEILQEQVDLTGGRFLSITI